MSVGEKLIKTKDDPFVKMTSEKMLILLHHVWVGVQVKFFPNYSLPK
jgi:hypothetical protein